MTREHMVDYAVRNTPNLISNMKAIWACSNLEDGFHSSQWRLYDVMRYHRPKIIEQFYKIKNWYEKYDPDNDDSTLASAMRRSDD